MTVPRIDSHDEPWLRDALASLLVDEPPLAPTVVVEDVRRGEVARAVVKRRRTAAYAIAAVLLAVAVPVGLLLRAGPSTSTPPASSITSAPRVEGVSQQWLDSISPAVVGAVPWVVDWPASTVSGTAATGISLDLTLVPVSITSGNPPVITLPTAPYPETARLRLAFLPTGSVPGPALAACPETQCPRDTPDRKFPEWLDVTATAATSTRFPSGTTILDRGYDAGRFVELVSSPSVDTSSRTVVRGTAVLGYAWASSVLDAIGDPAAAPSASPSPSASATPTVGGLRVWTPAAGYLPPDAFLAEVRSLVPDTVDQVGWAANGRLQAPAPVPPPVMVMLRSGAARGDLGVTERTEAGMSPGSGRPGFTPCQDSTGATRAGCVVASAWTQRFGAWVGATRDEGATACGESWQVLRGSVRVTVGLSGQSGYASCVGLGASAGSVPVLTSDQLEGLALALPVTLNLAPDVGSDEPVTTMSPVPSESPTPTSTLPLMRQTAAQTAYAIAHPCRASDLSVSVSTDGATGTLLSYYLFRNASSHPCGLRGYPTLGGVGGAALPFTVAYGVAQAGPNPIHPVQALLLDPGADATSLVTKYRCDVGERGTVTALVATVPGDGTPITLPESRQAICVGDAKASGNQIQVSAFYSVPG